MSQQRLPIDVLVNDLLLPFLDHYYLKIAVGVFFGALIWMVREDIQKRVRSDKYEIQKQVGGDMVSAFFMALLWPIFVLIGTVWFAIWAPWKGLALGCEALADHLRERQRLRTLNGLQGALTDAKQRLAAEQDPYLTHARQEVDRFLDLPPVLPADADEPDPRIFARGDYLGTPPTSPRQEDNFPYDP